MEERKPKWSLFLVAGTVPYQAQSEAVTTLVDDQLHCKFLSIVSQDSKSIAQYG